MFTVGQRPGDVPVHFFIASMTTAEALTREPRRRPSGQQPRPLKTTAQRAPAVVPKKQSWRSQSPFPSAKLRQNRVIDPTIESVCTGTLKIAIAASPSLSGPWHFRDPSAHPRYPESGNFPAYAAKNENKLAAARTRRRMSSLSSILVGFF